MKYRELRGLGGGAVYKYTSSIQHDKEIAGLVVKVMSAHLAALRDARLIPLEAASNLAAALLKIWEKPEKILGEGYEDVFEALESWLYSEAGSHAAWLPMGRSRNDQVSAALRLYAARCAADIVYRASDLRLRLLGKAETLLGLPLPGYTHGQPSQAITAGCLLAAYEESLADASKILLQAAELALRSPLGASAGGGSLAPLDERLPASLLGFRSVYRSSYYASGSRGFLEVLVGGLAALAVELSRIAGDMIVLFNPPLGILRLPRSHLATSSIMPHKSNPVTLEVVRAWAARVLGDAVAVLGIAAKLPYSYSLDLQEANPHVYDACRWTSTSLEILSDLAENMEFDEEAALKALREARPWSAEAAEYIALKEKRPLREVYGEIAGMISEKGLDETLKALNIDPLGLLKARKTGCSEKRIKHVVERARQDALSDASEARAIEEGLEKAWERLREELEKMAKLS